MNLLRQLLELQELFSDPARFTRRAMARDKENQVVAVDSLDAVKWCFLGGLIKISASRRADKNLVRYVAYGKKNPMDFLITSNDGGGGYDEVIKIINKAVACEVEWSSWF